MQIGILQYLIICPLVFIAGFIDAIAGGGGLISLPAYLIAGLPTHNAIATNKVSSSMGTVISTARYAKKGYIPWKTAAACVVAALIGSSLGARLSLMIDDSVLKIVMLFLLPLTALAVWKSKAVTNEDGDGLAPGLTILIATVVAFVIGTYDGFYGPGAGTLMILLLTMAARMKLQTANGVSKAINLSSNIGSLVVYFSNGKVILTLGLIAGLFGIAGNYFGSKMFDSRGAKITKPIMLVVLGIFFIKTIVELAGK